MGIMVHSLLWIMQEFYQQPYVPWASKCLTTKTPRPFNPDSNPWTLNPRPNTKISRALGGNWG